jgi:DNA-binding NarL/FixJ family response regulator
MKRKKSLAKTQTGNETMDAELATCREEVMFLRGKVAALMEMMQQKGGSLNPLMSGDVRQLQDTILLDAFQRMTLKQHAAFQLLMCGMDNKQMAEVFRMTESTAKTYVYRVMKHFDVKSRSQLLLKTKVFWDAYDPDEYQRLTGLRKNWALSINEQEPVMKLLRQKKGE